MTTLNPGDRVSHKRSGCKREYGTVASIWDEIGGSGNFMVLVHWDNGNKCLWDPRKLKLVSPGKGEVNDAT